MCYYPHILFFFRLAVLKELEAATRSSRLSLLNTSSTGTYYSNISFSTESFYVCDLSSGHSLHCCLYLLTFSIVYS